VTSAFTFTQQKSIAFIVGVVIINHLKTMKELAIGSST
jgi:hypothetical protein